MTDFVHLHVHTEYSLLDGAARIEDVVKKAVSLGQKAIAITDHGVMYGAVDFYRTARKYGIKPVIGCEVYTAARTRFDKMYELDGQIGHLILLARNNTGYQNLIYIVSKASVEGMYYKPRVDMQLLKEHSEGIIALSACLAGDVQRLLLAENYEGAKQKALEYADIFQDGFYLELQDHGLPEDKQVLDGLFRLAKETGLPMVATNDVHYVEQEDAKLQNVLMCIQMNKTIRDDNAFSFKTREFYLKSGDEMASLFQGVPDALQNSVRIAEMCDVSFEFGQYHLPNFPLEGDHYLRLKELAYDGLKHRYGDNAEKHIERLEYELTTIQKMGYVDYFLIVHDFIHYAKTNDIPVGPGRGSAAGSIVSYCLSITEIDPMRYDLLFERFLNPERVSMPDIDIDFCVEKRSRVIDYVVKKYGAANVAQIITFGTMAARGAVRDVGRALGASYQTADKVAKLIPFKLGMTLTDALQQSKELAALYQTDLEVREIIDMARRVEGFPRHASTHAAGVVITQQPVYRYVPIQLSDDTIVTQFPMTTLEELGLLKMDFLGLRNLTVIHETERLVKNVLPDFDISQVPIDDEGVYRLLSAGKTQGIFQLESDGIRQVLTRLKPKNIEDIIAVISLYRPGPMDSIDTYIQNKNDPSKIRYKDERLKAILGVTYGCIVYQEQVMQIVRTLAGYSYGRADLVRRAMSKKKMDVMQKERDIFINGLTTSDGTVEIEGCLRRGIDAKTAGALFDEMTDFAKYAFNKSHACCYAYVAYQTAYLKVHFPSEFMAAMMTSVMDNTPKIVGYIEECKKFGIAIEPPSVNKGIAGFNVHDGHIIYGLAAIKNIGKKFIDEMVRERDRDGEYRSFPDFIKRMRSHDIGKRTLESLIKAGAFDEFGFSRRHLLSVYEKVLSAIDRENAALSGGQMNLFGEVFTDEAFSIEQYFKNDGPEFSDEQKLAYEREVLGLFMTGHPLAGHAELYEKQGYLHIGDLLRRNVKIDENRTCKLLGVISSCKTKITKNKRSMAFITLEDESGSIEVIVFPNVFDRAQAILKEGSVICVEGKLSAEDDDGLKMICSDIMSVQLKRIENNLKKLYLKVPSRASSQWETVQRLIRQNRGGAGCVIFFEEDGTRISTKKDSGVDITDELLVMLRNLLGYNNVILK